MCGMSLWSTGFRIWQLELSRRVIGDRRLRVSRYIQDDNWAARPGIGMW